MGSRATKSQHVGMGMYEVAVRSARNLTPHLRRVTLAGEGLRGFCDDGPDQRFKLLLPRAHQDRPRVPDAGYGWYADWRAMPDAERPVMRTYTVAEARPESAELDVDMIVHPRGGGPGSTWAKSAEPGHRAAIYAAWAEYEVADPSVDQLIVGDLSALPAIAAILRRLGPDSRARVLIESRPDDRIALPCDGDAEITWLDPDAVPGAALGRAVAAAASRRTPEYAWVAADSDTVARIRRNLVRRCGMAPEQVMFMGYWRTGGAIDPE